MPPRSPTEFLDVAQDSNAVPVAADEGSAVTGPTPLTEMCWSVCLLTGDTLQVLCLEWRVYIPFHHTAVPQLLNSSGNL